METEVFKLHNSNRISLPSPIEMHIIIMQNSSVADAFLGHEILHIYTHTNKIIQIQL